MTRKISRRTFLATGAAVAASAALAGCEQYTRYVTLEPYVRMPEDTVAGEAIWYASACRMCPSGCGIIVRVMNGRAIKIEGNPEHPLNRGKLCARGQAGLQLLYNPDRLKTPLIQVKRGNRQLGTIPWEQAIDTLGRELQGAGNRVAMWASPATSGHLLDLLGRLATALGAPAPLVFDGQGALAGRAGLAAGAGRVFGGAGLPSYSLAGADVVLSFADFLGVGPAAVRYGYEYGQFRTQPLGLRGHLVQFESRMSITGAKADDWFGIRPGTEGLVAQALARVIADGALGPADRVDRARGLAGNVDVNAVAEQAGVPVAELTRIGRLLANAQHGVVIPNGGAAALDENGDALAAEQMLNAIVGPGNNIALTPAAPSPAIIQANEATWADATRFMDNLRGGGAQVLLLAGVNPLYDLPQKLGLAEALAAVPFIVTFSSLLDETGLESNLVLPERTYLETWGYTAAAPSFGVPIVTSQQPVVQPVVDARAAADVLLAVAKTIPAAASALTWNDEVALIRDTITQLPADGAAADAAGPDVAWARFLQHGGWWPANPPAPAPVTITTGAAPTLAAPPAQGSAQEFPFYLQVYEPVLTGMGVGASLPWLQGSPDPMTTIQWQTWVEIHPEAAAKLGVSYGDIVRVTSPNGEIEAPVYVYPVMRPDVIGIPLGQGHTSLGRYAQGRGANAVNLLAPNGAAGLTSAVVRVKVAATGKSVHLATFEWTPGVNQGFPNAGFPGE